MTAWLGVGCDGKADPTSEAAETKEGGKVELMMVPDHATDGPAFIAEQLQQTRSENKRMVIYVGATWCEPCKYFHDAAAAGQLDDVFPNVRFVEFDHDKHASMLQASDCRSKMIPLFAIPDESGRCTERRVAGAIKGPGAVDYLRPRISKLLD